MAISAISIPAPVAVSPLISPSAQEKAANAALQEAVSRGDTAAAQRAFEAVTRLAAQDRPGAATDPPQLSLTV